MSGETTSGFKYDVNENIGKDWEYLTLVDTIQNGKGTMSDVNAVLIMTIGEDGFADLKEHIRKQYGYVDVEAMKNEFAEIANATKVKNSPSSPSV